ncbi:pimeloyl-ACP methyl ester carboxylesterase [Massilia sp. UYP11]|uniref:hypothetical protein n=1 Tax=Massilia sp. UYP11 TaxID=1756385 RepID=UPI003D216E5F
MARGEAGSGLGLSIDRILQLGSARLRDNLVATIDKFTTEVGLTGYATYVIDDGAPIGYRLAASHPERISAIVVQNGNACDEGQVSR